MKMFESLRLMCCFATLALPCTSHSQRVKKAKQEIPVCCQKNLPTRLALKTGGNSATTLYLSLPASHEGMVWIKPGKFMMGSSTTEGRSDEYPRHPVKLNGFWMDATEVTNAEFKRFVEATGYITTAEKAPDWEELKKQLPPGIAKPPDSILVAASLVFTPPPQSVSLHDASQWWSWTKGANWRHPGGPTTSIEGKDNYPVVQVSWDDATAYAAWAGKRLPTEAEWEWAARAGLADQPSTWGSEDVNSGTAKANTWQGHFPELDTKWDGFGDAAPVKSFQANGNGLYDMAGNVWEWCSDWFHPDYYEQLSGKLAIDPRGPGQGYDPDEPSMPKRVVRGGSFLCHDSYCASYRVSARMKTSPDTGLQHTGFRCVSSK